MQLFKYYDCPIDSHSSQKKKKLDDLDLGDE